jgi:hypothetical protein
MLIERLLKNDHRSLTGRDLGSLETDSHKRLIQMDNQYLPVTIDSNENI